MSGDSDRDTILRRASKLAALAEAGGSLAEAESASAKLADLLAEHRLTMQEVTAAEMQGHIREDERQTPWKRLPRWAGLLARRIADACGCEVMSVRTVCTATRLSFIGEEADAAVAGYWFEVLMRVLPALAERNKAYLLSPKRSWTTTRDSFLMGAATRLGDRLRERLQPATGEAGASGRALSLAKHHAVDEYMEKQHPNLSPKKTVEVQADALAWQRGEDAANGVALADGVAHRACHPALMGAAS